MSGPLSVARSKNTSWSTLAEQVIAARRAVISCGVFGLLVGVTVALLSSARYASRTVFLPQAAEGSGLGGLATAASQFGIRVANTSGAWGPAVFVEILGSRSLLERLARDSLEVPERGGQKMALVDLLEVTGRTDQLRLANCISELRSLIAVREVRQFGGVQVVVTSPWPSVSQALATRLLTALNEFHVKVRKSQAVAERQFVEGRAVEALGLLRDSEDRMQEFVSRNRSAVSPELAFERDRLARQVTLRQAVYSSLVQNLEDARIREVRDTPVITVIEQPQLPQLPESRKRVLTVLLAVVLGLLLGGSLAVARFQIARSGNLDAVGTRALHILVSAGF